MTFELIDGEAFVTLKAGLGSDCSLRLAPSQSCETQNFYSLKQRSPSYYRRQERRKLSNQNKCASKAPMVAVNETEECDAGKAEVVCNAEQAETEGSFNIWKLIQQIALRLMCIHTCT